ncbi:DNA replication/repair protein RecF [Pararhizobium mangrovi]|uniref:DNA replication and repair protein RecF n=1 Tax=Pararhizobium mangrovi TaxID=2590452 RepID=A0A506TY24_9HYPH|nr:DNA replication/repair protein RecF [Pararhizobium mangrovi]TPW26098.1 DNA replication/repair protein RecF [Pararhizobium mangrovi]
MHVHLERLRLTDFRNYASLAVDLGPGHVVLTGENGAGKTNLMEAVSFLSPGRGLRRATYGEVVRREAPRGFSVFTNLQGMAGPADVGTGAGGPEESGARRLRINGAPASSAESLLEHLRVLWLTPAMDGLFTGPRSERRRFVDRLTLSIDPAHGKRALDYERAMRSRNRLLAEGRTDPVWLDGLEAQLAELGVAIALARRELVALLARMIERGQADGPFPQAGFALAGFAEEDEAAVDLEERLLADLRTGRMRDAAAGRTLSGPHRSDLLIRHKAKDMEAARSSTGEQKALLIGLVMAHARLVAEMTGHPPVLLLDEVAAHLDAGRRAALFDLIDALGGQAFMTGTDAAMFEALGTRAGFFTVANGAVERTA